MATKPTKNSKSAEIDTVNVEQTTIETVSEQTSEETASTMPTTNKSTADVVSPVAKEVTETPAKPDTELSAAQKRNMPHQLIK